MDGDATESDKLKSTPAVSHRSLSGNVQKKSYI